MAKNKSEVLICPRCGHQPASQEFLLSFEKMPHNVGLNFDPVAGRFLCSICGYSGPPIEVAKEDFGKITFDKKEYDPPLARINPDYYQSLLAGISIVIIAEFLFQPGWISWILAVIGGGISLHTILKVKRYREMPASKEDDKSSKA